MKKYAIIIGENNEELSRKVQEALFAAGFTWKFNGATSVKHTEKTLLLLNERNGDGYITWHNGQSKVDGMISKGGGFSSPHTSSLSPQSWRGPQSLARS